MITFEWDGAGRGRVRRCFFFFFLLLLGRSKGSYNIHLHKVLWIDQAFFLTDLISFRDQMSRPISIHPSNHLRDFLRFWQAQEKWPRAQLIGYDGFDSLTKFNPLFFISIQSLYTNLLISLSLSFLFFSTSPLSCPPRPTLEISIFKFCLFFIIKNNRVPSSWITHLD